MKNSGVTIKLSVEVSDDSYESHVTFPVDAEPSQIQLCVNAWLQMMQAALAMRSPSETPQLPQKP